MAGCRAHYPVTRVRVAPPPPWSCRLVEQSYDEVLAVLPEEVRDRVLAGELHAYPGKNPLKPVLRDAITGVLVKGTGLSPRAVDVGRISQETAYKRTKTYRQALEEAVPASSDPKVRRSVGWIIERLEVAMVGEMVTKKSICSDCGHVDVVDMYRKPDTYAAIKLLELVHGRARETQDINVNMTELHKILEERTPTREITVRTMDPAEVQRRKDTIEGEFKELPVGD